MTGKSLCHQYVIQCNIMLHSEVVFSAVISTLSNDSGRLYVKINTVLNQVSDLMSQLLNSLTEVIVNIASTVPCKECTGLLVCFCFAMRFGEVKKQAVKIHFRQL